MTLWENLFASLILALLVPAIWLSQTHAYLVLEKTLWMQRVEAGEIRVMEDVMHGSAIPQSVQEGGHVYGVRVTRKPDAQAPACQDQLVTLDDGESAAQTVILPLCTPGIFTS
ncbi:hypothetical protein IW967_12790 [Alicyclobacillus mali]|uniref:NusG domain-containing protein n=1 Tax=Alicyclobacillus mali (ex Roth et al. 2021) TaxID=1123961 RepID=A0ABS0F604_9BACL|nr:hypothetical protein [Alicyclobacillus mali (ex Roth et al. 2021)]MCL6488227.1 hypothetical protein [Alicyclobacillus mali (ex Roth et al. 2021)]